MTSPTPWRVEHLAEVWRLLDADGKFIIGFRTDLYPNAEELARTCARGSTITQEQCNEYPLLLAEVVPLRLEVNALQAAIRRHRDERGDDRCHADDGRLYAVLPEGDTRPERETAVTLENCAKYIECRQTGREYISPQRRIEELESDLAQLRAVAGELAKVWTDYVDSHHPETAASTCGLTMPTDPLRKLALLLAPTPEESK